MNRRRRIYEGKAKVLFEGPEPGTLIQHFKDDATAFNAKKHEVIRRQGRAEQSHQRVRVFSTSTTSALPTPLHPPAQHARAADPRGGRSSRLEVVCAQRRRRFARQSGSGSRRARSCPLDHRVLLQERQARRPDGVGGSTSTCVRLGHAPGDRSDIMALAIRSERLPVGALPGRLASALVDFKIECGRPLGRRPDAHRRSPTRSPPIRAGCGT